MTDHVVKLGFSFILLKIVCIMANHVAKLGFSFIYYYNNYIPNIAICSCSCFFYSTCVMNFVRTTVSSTNICPCRLQKYHRQW